MSGWAYLSESGKWHYFQNYRSLCGHYTHTCDLPGETNLHEDDPTVCQSCKRAEISHLARGELK